VHIAKISNGYFKDNVMSHYDSELSDFVHCPAEFGRLAVFGWSEESRANARWRYCLEELWSVIQTLAACFGSNQFVGNK